MPPPTLGDTSPELPPEIWDTILSFLPPCMRFMARMVCKEWDCLIPKITDPDERMQREHLPTFRQSLLMELCAEGYAKCIRSVFGSGCGGMSVTLKVGRELLLSAIRGNHLDVFEMILSCWPHAHRRSEENIVHIRKPTESEEVQAQQYLVSLLVECLSTGDDRCAFISLLIQTGYVDCSRLYFPSDTTCHIPPHLRLPVQLTSFDGGSNILFLLEKYDDVHISLFWLASVCGLTGDFPLLEVFWRKLDSAPFGERDRFRHIRLVLEGCMHWDHLRMAKLVLRKAGLSLPNVVPPPLVILGNASEEMFRLFTREWPDFSEHMRRGCTDHAVKGMRIDPFIASLANKHGSHMIRYIIEELHLHVRSPRLARRLLPRKHGGGGVQMSAANLLWVFDNHPDKLVYDLQTPRARTYILRASAGTAHLSDVINAIGYVRKVGEFPTTHKWVTCLWKRSSCMRCWGENVETCVEWLMGEGDIQREIVTYFQRFEYRGRARVLQELVSNGFWSVAMRMLAIWRDTDLWSESHSDLVKIVYREAKEMGDHRLCLSLCKGKGNLGLE